MRKVVEKIKIKAMMETRLEKYRQEIDTLSTAHEKAKEIAEDAIFAGDLKKYNVYKEKMTELYDRLVDLNDDLNRTATVYCTMFGKPIMG